MQSLGWSTLNFGHPLLTFVLCFWVVQTHPTLIASDNLLQNCGILRNHVSALLSNFHMLLSLFIAENAWHKFGRNYCECQIFL